MKPLNGMYQEAPFPVELSDLVACFHYRPGWTFELLPDFERDAGCRGLTLDIVTMGYNSYHPEQGETYGVHHYRIVPAATFNRQSWRRWLLEQCMIVDDHEACEFAAFDVHAEDGTVSGIEHPFAPNHGPGFDPYRIVEYETDVARRTRFTGEVGPDESNRPHDERA